MAWDRRLWLAWESSVSRGRRWSERAATFLGAAALLLALGDMALVLSNRADRRETDEQRQFIEQTAQLNGVNNNLVRQIARAAIEQKDQPLRDVLVSHGFHIQAEGPGPTVEPAAPEQKR